MAHFVGHVNSEVVAQIAVNCHSFDPVKGLQNGIELMLNMPKKPGSSEVYRPHVRCGGSFIATDNVFALDTSTKDGRCVVLKACLRTVTPNNGGDSFALLSSQHDTLDQFVRISTSLLSDTRVKQKFSPEHIRAWEGVIADQSVSKVLVDDSGVCLLKFTHDGQEALVYARTGAVYAIVRDHGVVKTKALSPTEMAKARVDQLESQLSVLEDTAENLRFKHGILGGAIRLLYLTRNDSSSREVLTNFLRRNIDFMLGKMKEDVRLFLLSCNDSSSVFFGEYGTDLTDLSAKLKVTRQKGPPASEIKRKRDRAENDRKFRMESRGGSSGGKLKKSGKK